MFDTIMGLPLHPLVIHVVVVLLPVAAIATAAVAVRPSWRRFATPLAGLNAVVMVAAFVATQSGEALEHRIEQLQTPPGLHEHAEWGDRLFWVSILLFLGALVIRVVRTRGETLARVVAALAVLGAVVAVGMTVYVGHTGATAVWSQTIENTSAGGGD